MAGFLVVQTDFGLQDGAVNAMYGVAYQVEPTLNINNLTHEIEPYNIHDASYRLLQAVTYWPAGTVFVSVVDPARRWLNPSQCRRRVEGWAICNYAR